MAFIIVGRDRPVYELHWTSREDIARQSQYVLHSALDMLELTVYANPATCVTALGGFEARGGTGEGRTRSRLATAGATARPPADGGHLPSAGMWCLMAAETQEPPPSAGSLRLAVNPLLLPSPPLAPLPTLLRAPRRYLKVVDRHESQMVSAYVTPGGYRFMLLHESRNEEGIRAFFQEVHELLLKVR